MALDPRMFDAADTVQHDYLGPMGLDPREWDLGYEPVQPKLRSKSEAYHPGIRGLLERVGPVLGDAFSEADWQSPMARMAARLARAYGDHLQHGVEDRQADIVAGNKQAEAGADEQNTFRRTQVAQNRASWLATARDRLPTPREVLQRKMDEKRALAAAGAEGQVQGRVGAMKDAGLTPTGTPKPKPTPKPKSYDPSSFRLFGDADKIQLDQLDQQEKDAMDELRQLKANPMTRAAFEPVRVAGGKPVKESPSIAATRMRKADLDKAVADVRTQKREAGKRALLWHAKNLPTDPNAALGVWQQLDRSAQSLGLQKDPDVDAALDAAAAALDKVK